MLKPKKRLAFSTVEEFYSELIAGYTDANRLGNARVYKDSLSSIKTFKKGKTDFFFNEIDVEWLENYEKWMRSKHCKETTISLQFRTLRSAYNKAVENERVKNEGNPFKKFKVSKFSVKTQKRAISKDDMLKIMKLDLSTLRYYHQLSRDIFIFSYLCGGINFSDMANLTLSQIIKGRLVYSRKKTKKVISIPLKPEAITIINKYMDDEVETDNYIFPILNKSIHITEQQKMNRIHKTIAKVNIALKEIGKIVGIEIKLTTYVARHSYATVLKNSGVNIALISETLGHSDLKTTQIYLDSFENEQIYEAMKNLL